MTRNFWKRSAAAPVLLGTMESNRSAMNRPRRRSAAAGCGAGFGRFGGSLVRGQPRGARRRDRSLGAQAQRVLVGDLPFAVMPIAQPEHAARPVGFGKRARGDQFLDPGLEVLLVIDID